MISKADALAAMNADEQAEFDALVEEVDTALKTYNGKDVVKVDLSTGASAKVISNIIAA